MSLLDDCAAQETGEGVDAGSDWDMTTALLCMSFLPVSVIAGALGLPLGPQPAAPLLQGLSLWAGGLIPDTSVAV